MSLPGTRYLFLEDDRTSPNSLFIIFIVYRNEGVDNETMAPVPMYILIPVGSRLCRPEPDQTGLWWVGLFTERGLIDLQLEPKWQRKEID